MRKTSLTLGLLALVGTVSPCGMYAAAPPPADIDTDMMAREYRDVPNGAGALTREMIEACVALKIELEKDKSDSDTLWKELQTLENEVEKLKAYIDNRKPFDVNDTSVDRTEYKAKAKEYNTKVQLMHKKKEQYEKLGPLYKEKDLKFEEECNGQLYYEDDYKAVEEKMGRGM